MPTEPPATVRELWHHSRAVLEETDVDNRRIRAAVLIMATCVGCGTNLKRLRLFTGIPWEDIHHVSWRLRRASIWQGPYFKAPWMDDEDSCWPIDFILYVLVAVGEIVSEDGETFRRRTVGYELGIDDDTLWRDIIKPRSLKRYGGEASHDEPFWVRRAS